MKISLHGLLIFSFSFFFFNVDTNCRYLSLEVARKKKPVVNWARVTPVAPTFLGARKVEYVLSDLIPYIDWNPFFQVRPLHISLNINYYNIQLNIPRINNIYFIFILLLQVWQLRGSYPTRNYPRVFEDAKVGEQARRLFEDAQAMLKEIVDNKSLKAVGVVAFYPAHSVQEDVEVFEDESREKKVATFYGLRQQAEKATDEPYSALGDFVAPKASGVKDYLGLFAVSAGFGLDEMIAGFKAKHDDFSIIMAQALADRLVCILFIPPHIPQIAPLNSVFGGGQAEAFAEKLHADVRTKLWGYSKDEHLDTADLLKIKYQVCCMPTNPYTFLGMAYPVACQPRKPR